MVLHPFVVFLSGLLILIAGAELLLKGASKLADMLGMSPVVIGLTIVALGTSIPELAVGLTAVTEGKGVLSVGNIAGANIVNILLILGLAALIKPIPLTQLYLKLDLFVMIAAAMALVGMAMDGMLRQWEGMLLLAGAVVYIVALLRAARQKRTAEASRPSSESSPAHSGHVWAQVSWNASMLLIGIAITILGADLLVSGAVKLAQIYGVSDAFIGLTIVAIGTTAPELATSLLAILRNQRSVAVGALIGSYIFNILVILGATVIFSVNGIALEKSMIWFDLPFVAVVAMMCAYACRTGKSMARKEGAFFMMTYFAYLGTLLVYRT